MGIILQISELPFYLYTSLHIGSWSERHKPLYAKPIRLCLQRNTHMHTKTKKAASVCASFFSLLMITSKLLLLRRRPTNLFADRIYDTGLLLHACI
jgi:hypothetical protein